MPGPETDAGRLETDRGRTKASTADLIPLLYVELRKLAHDRMASESPGHILQPTALVHEVYLRMGDADERQWNSPGHFFGSAARAMRRILVEWARRNGRSRHGGGRHKVSLDQLAVVDGGPSLEPLDLLDLDEALRRLEREDPRKSEVVLLKYFAGLSIEDTARALDVSVATVNRDWSYARAWLHHSMTRGSSPEANETDAG